MRKLQKIREDYAITLDFLPHGDPIRKINEPFYQAIGTNHFLLLALVPKRGKKVGLLEKVYIGEGERPNIKTVLKRMKYDDLTNIAKDNLPKAIEKIIKENEKRFVDFFNKAGPINIRVHTLELLPGIGKVTVNRILEERDKKLFDSLDDIRSRIKGFDPVSVLVNRIIRELSNKERHNLFVYKF